MFDKTVDYKDYFPEFIDDNVKLNETRRVIDEITELFGEKDLFEQCMIQRLSKLIRQLNHFEEVVFINYVSKNERIFIIKSIWEVLLREDISMGTKIRFGNILTSHINNYKKLYLRHWWHSDFTAKIDSEKSDIAKIKDEYVCKCSLNKNSKVNVKNCICGIIDSKLLVDSIEKECKSDCMDCTNTSSQKKKNYITCLSRILNSYRPYIGEGEIDIFIEKWLSLSTKNTSFFAYSKIFFLICNQHYSFKLLKSGYIFEIWKKLDGKLLNYWDSLMVTIVSRGIKYSWKFGIEIDGIYDKVPLLFEVLYTHIGVPILHNIVSNSINTGTTSSTSLVTTGSINLSVLQPKIPSIIKEVISSEILSSMSIKPINIYNKFSIIFVHLIKSLYTLEKGDDGLKSNLRIMIKCLQNLLNILYPLTHPSNSGKWSHSISIFIQAFTYQYCKRIYRERLELPEKKESKQLIENSFLCRFDDEYMLTIFIPLLEQGIYSKDIQISGRYEDSLKRWTYILPDILLNYLINIRIIPALEVETETHQVYVAFRLLSTITPLIMQFVPENIPRLLDLSLNGIDIADPMKINQALFFYTVLFYYSQSIPIRNLEFDEYEVIESISDSLLSNKEELNNYLADFSRANTLYNYPKNEYFVAYSDKSLISGQVPESIIEYTSINGKSPLELHFKNCLGEYNFILDNKQKVEFYYIMNKHFTRQVLLEKYSNRKVLIDTIFNHWIHYFMERLFNILENVTKPAETESYSSSVDLGISFALRSLIVNLFNKCKLLGLNDTLRDLYISISNWIDDNYYPDNYKHLSKILSAISSCDPELSFSTILEKLVCKIIAVDSGGGQGVVNKKIDFSCNNTSIKYKIKDIKDETYLLYYINLISSLVRYTNNSLLSAGNRGYYYIIHSLISCLLLDSRKRVKRAGIKLQERLIESLLHLQIMEVGFSKNDSGNGEVVSDEKQIVKLILTWGYPFYLQERSVLGDSTAGEYNIRRPNWYVPNKDSLNEVRKICVNNILLVTKLIREYVVSNLRKGKEGHDQGLNEKHSNVLDDLFTRYDQIKKDICGADDIVFNTRLGLSVSGLVSEERRGFCENDDLKGNSVNELLFCLNNMRIINKSVSAVFANVNTEKCERGNGEDIEDEDSEDERGECGYNGNKTVSQRNMLLRGDLHVEFGSLFFKRYFEDVQKIALYLAEVITGVRITYCKMNSDSSNSNGDYYYKLVDPAVNINVTEEIKLKLKFIKAINQSLNHYYSSASNLSLSSLYNTSFSESVLSWLSYTNGLFYQSSMLNSPEIFWLKNVQYYWHKRINMLRHEYKFSGYRKKLIYVLVLYSIGNYNGIRKSAQSALKDSLNSHLYSRNNIVQFVFFEVYISILLYENKIMCGEDECVGGDECKDSANDRVSCKRFRDVLLSNIKYMVRKYKEEGRSLNKDKSGTNQVENVYSEYLFSNLSGFSFIIMNNSSLQRLLWSNFDVLLHYYVIHSYISSLKMGKENIQLRIYNELYYTMNNRDYKSLLFQFILKNSKTRLFDGAGSSCVNLKLSHLFESGIADKSEFLYKIVKFYFKSENLDSESQLEQLLGVFIGELDAKSVFKDGLFLRKSFIILMYIQGMLNNAYYSNSSEFFKSVTRSYWNFLWSVMFDSNRSSGNSGFYSVIMHNLTSLLKLILERDEELFADLARTSEAFSEFNQEKLKALMENLVNVCNYHVQISQGNSGSGSRGDRKTLGTSNSSTCINNIVLNYNSTLNPFPYHRVKCYSNNISLNSVLFVQYLFVLFHYKYDNESCSRVESENIIDALLGVLTDWSSNANIITEKEKHIVILTFVSALFSASTYSNALRSFIMEFVNKDKLSDILSSEFQQSDQEFVFNLMDCIKYSLNPCVRQSVDYYYCSNKMEFETNCGKSTVNPINEVTNLLLDFLINPFNIVDYPSKEENSLSTFEIIKHLRIYQTGLIELVMSNNDSVDVEYLTCAEFENYYNKGLSLLESTLSKDNNYKQLREETSNMLHTFAISCNIINSRGSLIESCDSKSRINYVNQNLFKLINDLVENINGDMDHLVVRMKNKEVAGEEKSIDQGSRVAQKTEIILYYCLIRHLYSCNSSKVKVDELLPLDQLLKIIFKLQLIYNNNDILGLSYNSLMSLLTKVNLSKDTSTRDLDFIIKELVENYVNIGDFDANSKEYKSLVSLKIRINTIVGEYYPFLINGRKLQLNIISNIICGLFDENIEVRYISKQGFCTLFRTLPCFLSVKYIKLFMYWILNNSTSTNNNIGLYEKSITSLDISKIISELCVEAPSGLVKLNESVGLLQNAYCRAGVNGLISVILSHPFDTPFWLPETLTLLANCIGRNISHTLKKQIQECIQEFFKTHQDGWNIVHKHKFTDIQLEILDIYKGRPTYFT
ncbi:hypothetical protein FG386_001327 [Cryptosporidium ryanae]|uniref:uncharacterized protein n=1 Tax=Cryptosporidium ryanae TaxID=515981 RepID=UPI003519EF49|nr:hypothetical protein FG386_001327 [Cryptosporidium ryanae]